MSKKEQYRELLRDLGFIALGALLLLAPALYNQYPLLYSDMGTYMRCGFTGSVSLSRPIGYGWFIVLSSLKFSLWLTVAAQALITSFLLQQTLRTLFKREQTRSLLLIFSGILTLGTAAGWYVGMVMPDLFAAWAILCLYLFLRLERRQWPVTVGVGIIFLWACLSHFSHASSSLLLLFTAALILVLRQGLKNFLQHFAARMGIAFGLVLISMLVIMSVNAGQGHGFRYTLSSHVFLMGRMSETGILESYLKEHCAEKNYRLCAFADSLPPAAADFIWAGDGPFRRSGWWADSETEYKEILGGILRSPKYLSLFIWEGGEATLKQLFQVRFGTKIFVRYEEGSPPYNHIQRHLPREIKEVQQAKQYKQELDFSTLNMVNYVLQIASFIFLVLVFAKQKDRISEASRLLVGVVAGGLIFNAAVTAALGNVFDRLQARVAWLLPFIALIVLWELYGKKISKRFA